MDNFDYTLEEQIRNDRLKTKPSDAVYNKLHNQMLAKSGTIKLKQNSFIPTFSQYAGKKQIAWKISVAAVLLISFMGIKQINQNPAYIQTADSTNIKQTADTLSFQLADSSFVY